MNKKTMSEFIMENWVKEIGPLYESGGDYEPVGRGCYTIELYNASLDAGYFIRDGLWYEDDYNVIDKADPREIEIANLFKSTKQKYNRLAMLNI
jgi:hypothetical protein